MKRGVKVLLAGLLVLLLLLILGGLFARDKFFGAPNPQNSQTQTLVISRETDKEAVFAQLASQGLIKNKAAFSWLFFKKHGFAKIEPGGYYLRPDMDALAVAEKLSSPPDMVWVTIPEGWRKEEIGERLAKVLGWSGEELEKWNEVYTQMRFDYQEGVYFPDTYLIGRQEDGLTVANRLISRFEEKAAPILAEFAQKDILWTTGLKIASLVQREAAGDEDMALIAGVIWNRLNIGMKLDIDATVQYARGKTETGWWAPIKVADKQIDSPYNTYLYAGLPPTPICNPGLKALAAAARPQETDCLFYFHDSARQIHCSPTYEEHLEKIDQYLR